MYWLRIRGMLLGRFYDAPTDGAPGSGTPTPPAGDQQTPGNGQTPSPTPTPPPVITPAPTSRTYTWDDMHEVRQESKARRLRIEELEKELSSTKSKSTELETLVRDLTIGVTVTDALKEAGALSPSLLLRAGEIDISKLKIDEDGSVNKESLAAAVDTAKTAHPELFGSEKQAAIPNADANAKGKGAGALTQELINKMTDVEMKSRMPEIQEFYKTNGK